MNYITYSPDTAALLDEVAQAAPQFILNNEDGTQSIGPLTKTPTIRNGNETLAVVKDLPAELIGLTNLTIIGTQWWDAAGDPQITLGTDALTQVEAQAIYDRVYPCAPVNDVGPGGEVSTYTPPPIFGCVR